ncbi:hypothetical protein PR048_024099 [Dryococelus australis]|uniref:Uncharacterized protein n=1 Tax=Dryococelus australis TaxID=614101 RepID=A0ABQ9GVY0_9NEOP|nr:hypothetical protein PR048_024099 [Dryococelus australis]
MQRAKKNITVVKFCVWLSKLLSPNIMRIFPLCGHSYNQNNLKKKSNALSSLANILRTPTTKNKPFHIQKCVILKYMPGSFMATESYNAVFQHYNLKGKGCEEMGLQKDTILFSPKHPYHH